MKLYEFLGGNKEELLFHETEIKFFVHKALINNETRTMIDYYMTSLQAPKNITVSVSGTVRIFTPSGIDCGSNPEKDEDYLPFAL